MIKSLLAVCELPAKLAGIFLVGALAGCQTGKPPEAVAQAFWEALAKGQVDVARQEATLASQNLVNLQAIDRNSAIALGETENDEPLASVQTTIIRNNQAITFKTALAQENELWKVDYVHTQLNIAMIPFGEMLSSLENLGGLFANQLQEQLPRIQSEMMQRLPEIQQEMERRLPQIQKEMQHFGENLKQQIEAFGRALEQPQTLPRAKPKANTI